MGFFIRSLIRRKWEGNRRRDQVRLSTQPLPQGVEVRPGIPYLEDGDPMHTLNLYRPAGVSGPLPTIVDIHGGGWMYGDRELNRAYCMYLLRRHGHELPPGAPDRHQRPDPGRIRQSGVAGRPRGGVRL